MNWWLGWVNICDLRNTYGDNCLEWFPRVTESTLDPDRIRDGDAFYSKDGGYADPRTSVQVFDNWR